MIASKEALEQFWTTRSPRPDAEVRAMKRWTREQGLELAEVEQNQAPSIKRFKEAGGRNRKA